MLFKLFLKLGQVVLSLLFRLFYSHLLGQLLVAILNMLKTCKSEQDRG